MANTHSNTTEKRPAVLTIGTFDGVHLGHRAILDELHRHASALNGRSVVITFEPHPRQVLQPETTISILTPLDEKLRLLREAGVDEISVTPFTREFAQLSAEAYVREFLVEQYHPVAIVIGYDHRFGADRKGDISLLKELGKHYGIAVHELPAHMIDDAAVSSTKIRAALKEGDVTRAAQMLGRSYSLAGTVVHGQQLGRTLGYPTANIHPISADQLVPANGIYAVRVTVDGQIYSSMLSIGVRPTVSNNGIVSIEAYLFDFSGDLYGKHVTVHFEARMRDELKFESLEALIAALQQDERDARALLGC